MAMPLGSRSSYNLLQDYASGKVESICGAYVEGVL